MVNRFRRRVYILNKPCIYINYVNEYTAVLNKVFIIK